MSSNTTVAVSHCPPPAVSPAPWRHLSLHRVGEVNGAVASVLEELADAGYSDDEMFAIRLSLEEALVNAVKHGHRGDPAKQVRLRYCIAADRFTAEVEDEGPGFDQAGVADPLDPANWERDGGRGLFLMRHHMTSVRYNAAGNCVTLCKQRRQS